MEEPGSTSTQPKRSSLDDDMKEKDLRNFWWKKLLQFIIVPLAMIFDSQQSFISIYTDSYPTWHCTNNTTCNPNSDICKLSLSDWAWDATSSKTIISQFNLQCANSFITSLPQSSFFIGAFLGGFFLSALGDSSLGRKNLLFLSCFKLSIASLAIIFSTNIWIYISLKFIIGLGHSVISTCVLVLLTEKVSKEWRPQVVILVFSNYTLGYLSLPVIAYLNRDSSWKSLYLWTSIPAICFCLSAYFFVTESPRWLVIQGREEAMAVLKEANPTEGGGDLASCLLEGPAKANPKASILGFYSSVAELFLKRWAVQRILAVIVLGFGTGMEYYGMSLGVGNLGFNIYLSVLFNALMGVPSYIATFLLGKCRRKVSIISLTTISGISSILCVIVGNGLQGAKIGLELVSLFCVNTALNVMYIYIVELFPTSVRSTASALMKQAIACGAISGPFLVAKGRKNEIFSYGAFGVIVMCCGFSVACLPETKGIVLCDTMEQQEHKESISLCEMGSE